MLVGLSGRVSSKGAVFCCLTEGMAVILVVPASENRRGACRFQPPAMVLKIGAAAWPRRVAVESGYHFW